MSNETNSEGEPLIRQDGSSDRKQFSKRDIEKRFGGWSGSASMSNFAPDVHPRLAHLAVTGEDVKDEPKLAVEEREREKIKQRHVKDAIDQKYAEMRADLEIGKRVASTLHDHAFKHKWRSDLASNVLVEALQREQDSYVQFVDVSKHRAREAAKRVSVLKEQHPEWEIEPIDVTGALEDTTPHEEINIEGIHPVMAVRKHVQDPPDEIRFAVPNVDLPMRSELDPVDLKFDIVRYVNVEKMPEELRNVIRAYLSATRGTSLGGFKHFRKRVMELVEKTDELHGDDDPKKETVAQAKRDTEVHWSDHATERWRRLAFSSPACRKKETR